MSARAQIRTGQAVIGEPASVCSAPDGRNDGFNTDLPHGRACPLYQLHVIPENILHVIVGVPDIGADTSFAVFAVEKSTACRKELFFRLKFFSVVVADNIIHNGFFHTAVQRVKVVEALIPFCMLRAVGFREQPVKFSRHPQGIEHFVFRVSGMDALSFNRNSRGSGVEGLIFNASQCPAVHGIGALRSESGNIKTVDAAADFLVRRKPDGNTAVPDLRMCQQIFSHAHDLGNTGFVIRAEESRPVRDYQFFPFIACESREIRCLHEDVLLRVQTDILSVIIRDAAGFYILPGQSG